MITDFWHRPQLRSSQASKVPVSDVANGFHIHVELKLERAESAPSQVRTEPDLIEHNFYALKGIRTDPLAISRPWTKFQARVMLSRLSMEYLCNVDLFRVSPILSRQDTED